MLIIPNEIVYEIFSYFKRLIHFFNAKLVCKNWYQVYLMIQNDNKMNHSYFEIINMIQQITQHCQLLDTQSTIKPQQIYDFNSVAKWNPFEFYFVDKCLYVKLPNKKFHLLLSNETDENDDRVCFKNQGNYKFCFFHDSEDDFYCVFSIKFHQHKKPTIGYHCDDSLCNVVFDNCNFTHGTHVYNLWVDGPRSDITELSIFNKNGRRLSGHDLSFNINDFTCYFSCGWLFIPYLEEIYDLKTMRTFEFDDNFSLVKNTHFLFFGYDFCFVWCNGKSFRVNFYSKKFETKKITTNTNFRTNELTVNEEIEKVKEKFFFKLVRFPNYDFLYHDNSNLVESELTRDFFFVTESGEICLFDN